MLCEHTSLFCEFLSLIDPNDPRQQPSIAQTRLVLAPSLRIQFQQLPRPAGKRAETLPSRNTVPCLRMQIPSCRSIRPVSSLFMLLSRTHGLSIEGTFGFKFFYSTSAIFSNNSSRQAIRGRCRLFRRHGVSPPRTFFGAKSW